MDITVYLPDEIGQRAKDASVKFSALLREAVINELDRIETLEQSRDGMVPQQVEIGGNPPTLLRFTGKLIAGDMGIAVYETDKGAVILAEDEDHAHFDDVQEFMYWVDNETRANRGRAAETVLGEAVVEFGGPRIIEY